MDFAEASRLFAHAANLDRRLAPPTEERGLTIVASWHDLLRGVPLDFALHEVSRYYRDAPQWSIQPGVIYQAWRHEEDRHADMERARIERERRERYMDQPQIAGERVTNEEMGLADDDVPTMGQVFGALVSRDCPPELREWMERDVAAGKQALFDREARLRRVGVDQFRHEQAQAARTKQEAVRQEYRDRPARPEAAPVVDLADVAERHCGDRGCHCPHVRCRGGFLDGPDTLRETPFGITHAVERCPTCWDAVLMRGERT